MTLKRSSSPWLAYALAALASITYSQNLSFFVEAFTRPLQTYPFHAAATKNARQRGPNSINVGATGTRLNLSSDNIFCRIANTIESSLATAQSVLFLGRVPGALPEGIRRVPIQFIAALGDPASSSAASGAKQWGIWRINPGPHGVYVREFQSDPSLGSSDARMPSGWKFNPSDFWIEEYGRVIEKPDFPLTPGRYLVTGRREATTLLTVSSPNEEGEQGWEFGDAGVTLYNVTHLPCRLARYTPMKGEKSSPADANWSDFLVTPGS